MPRIRQKADEYSTKDFVAEINAQCGRYGYKTQQSLAEAIGVSQPTVGSYLKNPENIQLGKLRTLVKLLHPDPLVVLKALGYTTKDIRQLHERWK